MARPEDTSYEPLRLAIPLYKADSATKGLNVDPGANVSCVARFSVGADGFLNR